MTTQTTPSITTPLYLAYVAAQQALDAAIAAETASECQRTDVCAQSESPTCICPTVLAAEAVVEAARTSRDAALAAYLASDEPRAYRLMEGDGCGGYEIEIFDADSDSEAVRYAEEYDLSGGDYGERAETVWTDLWVIRVVDGERISGRISRAIEPDEPACTSDDGHDWQSPHDIIGGIESNPGVWGHGGGVIIHECCMHCGCRRTTDTWAQRRDTGEQGLTSVSYEPDYYDLPAAEDA